MGYSQEKDASFFFLSSSPSQLEREEVTKRDTCSRRSKGLAVPLSKTHREKRKRKKEEEKKQVDVWTGPRWSTEKTKKRRAHFEANGLLARESRSERQRQSAYRYRYVQRQRESFRERERVSRSQGRERVLRENFSSGREKRERRRERKKTRRRRGSESEREEREREESAHTQFKLVESSNNLFFTILEI